MVMIAELSEDVVERASDSIPNTRCWARMLHGTQTDKNGLPYVTHLDAVASNLYFLVGLDPELLKACYLHDTIEDVAGFKAEFLEREGFTDRTIFAVNVVTKRKAEPNYDYMRRIIVAGVDPALVKLADLYHNTDPERLAKLPNYDQRRLKEKYYSAIYRLENFLVNEGVLTEEQRTITFKEAFDAVQPTYTTTYSTGGAVADWWKRPLSSIWKGDLLRFPDSFEPERDWVVLDRRVKQNGTYALTLEGWDGDVVLSKESTYLSKFVSSAVHSGTFHAIWKKRLGLPAEWTSGDPVPQYLEGEKGQTVETGPAEEDSKVAAPTT